LCDVPELPDITVYLDALAPRILGRTLLGVDVVSPFLLRSVEPPLAACAGKRVVALRRIGKRIVAGLEDRLFLVIHLMVGGRLQWRAGAFKLARRRTLAALRFDNGTLLLTEAGATRRASLHLVQGESGLTPFDRGGLEVLGANQAEFAARLRSESHTVKRALADPRLLSGIGNAYSDEILHHARLSPMLLTTRLTDQQMTRLYEATRSTLRDWIERLRREALDGFPEKVTAFRDGMAVHGRFRQPCPDCGEPVQRIRYAENETNYCARCQTGGKLLADRGLSRLLKDDWPRSLDELEDLIEEGRHRGAADL
jgi:formamidopyrimidine-DNA glycosylase